MKKNNNEQTNKKKHTSKNRKLTCAIILTYWLWPIVLFL